MAINLATFSDITSDITKAPAKQRARAGRAFSLGSRPGITRGFIGIGHGLCQIRGRWVSAAVLHCKALAMASVACLLVSGDTWPEMLPLCRRRCPKASGHLFC